MLAIEIWFALSIDVDRVMEESRELLDGSGKGRRAGTGCALADCIMSAFQRTLMMVVGG